MISIAVCDDDKNFVVNKLRGIFKELNSVCASKLSVRYYDSGIELIEHFKSGYIPDIVILDIKMPEIDGKELANKLREYDKDFSLVFLTSYSYEIFDVIKYQISAFISKYRTNDLYISELLRVVNDRIQRQKEFELINVYKNGEIYLIKIPLNNILGFFTIRGNIYIKTINKEMILQETIFKKIKDVYIPKGFFESARGYIVNLNRILEIKADSIILDNNDIYPVSRRCLKPLIAAFNNKILVEISH